MAHNKSDALLALTTKLQKQDVRGSKVAESVPADETSAGEPKPSTPTRVLHLWLYEEDEKLLTELATTLRLQGVRVADSMIIRGALRACQTGPKFIEGCQKALELDRRFKKTKDKAASLNRHKMTR